MRNRLTGLLAAALAAQLFAGIAFAQQADPASPGPAALVPPRLTEPSEPVYPTAARAAGVGASVMLLLTVGADGRVTDVAVESVELGPGNAAAAADDYRDGFAVAAADAARGLVFAPARRDGVAVPVRIRYRYAFEPPATGPIDVGPALPSLGAPPPAPAQTETPGVENVAGTLVERGTRKPVVGAVVTVFRGEGEQTEGYEAVTDAKGSFAFYDLPAGDWRILAESPGYYPYRTTETVRNDEGLDVKYFIERGSYNPYDVTVRAERPKKEVNRRSLDGNDIARVAGTLGDPVLVVENLPGVARPTPGSGDILIRGSGPQDTGVFIDGISIPIIYHFAGLRSVIPAQIVEGVDLYPGNYSQYFGRFTGGVFNARIKEIKPERVGGAVEVSALDASAYVEVPLGDTAALAISGRRSYIDGVLELAVPEDAPVNLVSAPRYYDYQLMFNWRPSPAHFVRVFGLGSDDQLRLLFENPADVDVRLEGGDSSLTTAFQRLSLAYSYTPNDKWSASTLLAAGRDDLRFNFAQFRFEQAQTLLQARQTVSWRPASSLSVDVGFDGLYDVNDFDVLAPRPPREGDVGNPSAEDVLFTRVRDESRLQTGMYVEATWKPFERLMIVPGLRVDYFGRVDEWSVDPRATARLSVADQWTVKAGAAVVHQSPTLQELNDVFGNPALDLIRGTQYSAGVEWRPRDHLYFDVTGFVKQLDELTSASDATVERGGMTVPEVLNNGATGNVIGLELFAEHRFHENLRGWLAYTLSRARRTDSGAMRSRPFDFDQTHILNINASYQLPRNWEVGFRWRLVSGNPETPVVGSGLLVDDDEYEAVFGETNSSRLPLFHQLDLRIDKTWVYDEWRFGAFLSLNNAYNRGNAEARSYNFDFSQSGVTTGLPLFPIVGVKGEF